jgi:hypothetical protein
MEINLSVRLSFVAVVKDFGCYGVSTQGEASPYVAFGEALK